MQINYRKTKTKSNICLSSDFFRDVKIVGIIAGICFICVFVLPIVFAILKNLWWILPLAVLAGICWFVPLKTITNIRYHDGTCQWPKSQLRRRRV